ncbi:MAG: metallophosphoesterase family protein [Chloroflexi bacterium]|nr:metallophosphoesterase family protein [Chloroflexota bacterium]
MIIGLVSDTHIPEAGRDIPPQLFEVFAGARVEMILHAGDIYDPSCLDALERVAPVYACEGNGDDLRRIVDRRIERTQVLEIGGLRVGLTHGLAIPEIPPVRTLESVMQHEFGRPVDVIVFGDTHTEEVLTLKGVLMVNPGSPTLPHNLTHLIGTVGLLEINQGRPPLARIIHLESMTELDMQNPVRWWSVR